LRQPKHIFSETQRNAFLLIFLQIPLLHSH